MRILAIGLAALLLGSLVQGEQRVFFVGNSFINASGSRETIPSIFKALAEAGGHAVPETLMQYISGGAFSHHLDGATTGRPMNLPTTTLMDTGTGSPWTHVIMTNVSSQPTRAGDVDKHMADGIKLYELVKASNPRAKVTLNQSWGRSTAHAWMDGHPYNSPDEMADELWENYSALADTINAEHPDFYPVVVAPIGNAWGNAGGYLEPGEPGYHDLHGGDEYHGNDQGHYLTGCVNYAMFYGVSPEGLHTHPAVGNLTLSITDSQAAHLETVAWQTALAADVASQRILIDFGADASPTSADPIRGDFWNNLPLSAGNTLGFGLSTLLSNSGAATGVNLHVLSAFDASISDGTTVSTRYPASASVDSLTGGVDAFPSIQLSGLNPDAAYRIRFYASRTSDTEPLPTRYTVTGEAESSVVLDASGTIDAVAETEALFPDTKGMLTIDLSPESGSAQTSLGALELTVLPERRLKFTVQPQSRSAGLHQSVTFSAELNVEYALEVQWFRNGVPIPGADTLNYTIDSVGADSDGADFYVLVSNDIVSIGSDTVTLTLSGDETPPTLNSVETSAADKLKLTFSEPLDAAGSFHLN